jgi:hypothetical protein
MSPAIAALPFRIRRIFQSHLWGDSESLFRGSEFHDRSC